jgi:hypothetical protein
MKIRSYLLQDIFKIKVNNKNKNNKKQPAGIA